MPKVPKNNNKCELCKQRIKFSHHAFCYTCLRSLEKNGAIDFSKRKKPNSEYWDFDD